MSDLAAIKSYINQLKTLTTNSYDVYDYPGENAMRTAFETACVKSGCICTVANTENIRTFLPGSYNYKGDFTITTYSY